MSDALDHLDAAIDQVLKARSAVMARRSVQVHGADERERLKSVAFAWFKTHRQHVHEVDLQAVDKAFQTILDSTSRSAARKTYTGALKAAKEALVVARGLAAAARSTPTPPSGGFHHDAPPNFSSLGADVTMQTILERRWNEVQRCISTEANLAATVMMGGLLESLLLARINICSAKGPLFTAKAAPRDKAGKTLPLPDWKLLAMVEVAHEVGWITKSAKDVGNVLRDFRNYIHPHKEHTDAIVLTNDDVVMFWEISKAIATQVLASVGRSP